MRARLVILAIVAMSVTALADDAALRKAIIGTWRNGDFVVTYNADGSMHDAVPAETKWSVRNGVLYDNRNSFKILSVSKTKLVIQDEAHGRHTGTLTRMAP